MRARPSHIPATRPPAPSWWRPANARSISSPARARQIKYPVGVGRSGQQWFGATRIVSKHIKPAWKPPRVDPRPPLAGLLHRVSRLAEESRWAPRRWCCATTSSPSTAPTTPDRSAATSPRAASACTTRTSWTCSAASRSARAWCSRAARHRAASHRVRRQPARKCRRHPRAQVVEDAGGCGKFASGVIGPVLGGELQDFARLLDRLVDRVASRGHARRIGERHAVATVGLLVDQRNVWAMRQSFSIQPAYGSRVRTIGKSDFGCGQSPPGALRCTNCVRTTCDTLSACRSGDNITASRARDPNWPMADEVHTRSTNESTTRFSPARSNAMVSLLPSTTVTLPLPNFW